MGTITDGNMKIDESKTICLRKNEPRKVENQKDQTWEC
jgi:hypothetical protein